MDLLTEQQTPGAATVPLNVYCVPVVTLSECACDTSIRSLVADAVIAAVKVVKALVQLAPVPAPVASLSTYQSAIARAHDLRHALGSQQAKAPE